MASGARVERDETAAKPAALVRRRRAGRFLPGGDRHVEPFAVQSWGAGNPSGWVVVDLCLPECLARNRVERMHERALVAKEENVAVAFVEPRDRDCGARS